VKTKYLLSLFLSASPTKPEKHNKKKDKPIEGIAEGISAIGKEEDIHTPQRQIILIVAKTREQHIQKIKSVRWIS
jgi:hypothetical protein